MRGYSIVGSTGRALAFLVLVGLSFPSLAPGQPSSTPFSIAPGSFQLAPSILQAGAHPDLTVRLAFSGSADGRPFNDVKDVVLDLPAGISGAPAAVPACSLAQLLSEGVKPQCPPDSQLGTISVAVTVATGVQLRFTLPVFNMERSDPGAAAVLGFRALVLSQLVPMSMRPGDGGLRVEIRNIPLAAEPSRVSLTIWGVPASASHDAERGRECTTEGHGEGEESCSGGGIPGGVPLRPFLDNPTRCGPATARVEANSWEEPESWSKAGAEVGPFAGCEAVPFEPSLEVATGSDAAESPTGLDVSLRLPHDRVGPDSIVSSSLAAATIALPEGVSINAAASPGVCSREEFEGATSATAVAGGCPVESKLGTAELETPLLEEAAIGSIYMAKPFDNPFRSRFALYILAGVPASGAFVRLAARLHPDSLTGRLRLGFEDVPQLPLSRLSLHLPQGSDSLLVTPATCGRHAVEAELTPSSDPARPRHLASAIEIVHGEQGGACTGETQFRPRIAAEVRGRAAGAFSSLRLQLRRNDGEAQIARLGLGLPPGFVANLTSLIACPDVALAGAAEKTGAEERADPSCPPASAIGHLLVGTGVGPRLNRVRGSLYVAGRYHGAALSLAAVIPARLGPFDLGTVVVRQALRVSRRSGQLLLDPLRSDPVPPILEGIPLRLRELDVHLDRRRFLRNPTSCEPLSIEVGATRTTGLAGGSELPFALPLPFRATGCDGLRFAPRLRVGLSDGVHRNGHPKLRIVLASRRAEAGIAGAAIQLPPTDLLDLSHLRGICGPGAFRARRCPEGSLYGYAKAFTPFLLEPLKGAVYLRATPHGLPSLAAALHNRQMDFDLGLRLEAASGGLRFAPEALPDVPISKLVFEMRGGRGGLLVNSVDLCAARRRAIARLTAHNGKRREMRPWLKVSCGRGRQ